MNRRFVVHHPNHNFAAFLLKLVSNGQCVAGVSKDSIFHWCDDEGDDSVSRQHGESVVPTFWRLSPRFVPSVFG